MTLIPAFLIFLPKILAGFAIIHLLWKDLDFPACILKISLGVPLGLALSSSLFFIATSSGIAPQTYSWIEFWGVLLLVVLFLVHRFLFKKERITFPDFSWQDVLGAGMLLAGVVFTVSAFLYYARSHPYGFEDAWSIWNLPARIIFRQNSSDLLLHNQFYNRFHPDYPVNLPLNVAWGWFMLRNETPRLPIAIALLVSLSSGFVAWGTLRKWKGAIAAALAGLIILISSNIIAAIGQYADPFLALYILSAAAMLYGFLNEKNPNLLLLAGLMAGFSAWVKNEGLLFIVVFTMVCLLAAWKKLVPWKNLKSLVLGLIVPLIIVLAFKYVVSWQSDLASGASSSAMQLLDISRWLFIARSFAIYIWNYANWPVSILILLVIYSFLVGPDRGDSQNHILLLLIVIGQLAGYFLIYLITPHDLQLHITTSLDRLISHIFPVTILWLFVALRSPELKLNDQGK